MKIAIIGAGVSGLVAAHRLHANHEITVFEAGDYAGGHTNTVCVPTDGGREIAVDTGFIVFNHATYPNFTRLLRQLGVETQPTEMSFSVRNEATGLEYNGHTLNTLFAQRRNLFRPSFHRMIREILRFNRDAKAWLREEHGDESLGDFLDRGRYSPLLLTNYILPMGAAIWSCTPDTVRGFPARFFLRFFDNHGMLNVSDRPEWRTIKGGSHNYVRALVQPFRHRIRLRSPVEAVRRSRHGVHVKPSGAAEERFDALVLAVHSDQALRMLADPSPAEREVLGAIRYGPSEAILHTDASLMPRRRRAWASWNYHVLPEPRDRVVVTYNMNILQRLDAPVTYLVSLNREEAVDPRRILGRFTYHHPIFTPDAVDAQARHGEINGVNRTYYCGAYWRNGFHEDGVVSALTAVEDLERDARVRPGVAVAAGVRGGAS